MMNLSKFLTKRKSQKTSYNQNLFIPSTSRQTQGFNYQKYKENFKSNKLKNPKSERINTKYPLRIKDSSTKQKNIINSLNRNRNSHTEAKTILSPKCEQVKKRSSFKSPPIELYKRHKLNKSEDYKNYSIEELKCLLLKENNDLKNKIEEIKKQKIKFENETKEETEDMENITKKIKDFSQKIVDLIEEKKKISSKIVITNKKIKFLQIKTSQNEQKKKLISKDLKKLIDLLCIDNNKKNKYNNNNENYLNDDEFEIEFL